MGNWLVERCFMSLSAVFQSHHGNISYYSCLSWVSPVPGWGSEVSCPRTLPRKKTPEDPVRLEPRTPGLRVNHFITEPRRTPTLWEKEKLLIMSNFSFSHSVFKRLVLQTGKNLGLLGKGVMLLVCLNKWMVMIQD